MKPVYKIEANGTDITARIKGRLLSATLVDNEGVKSDTFEMVLDDRENAMVLPPAHAELKVWLGYLSKGLEYKGLFVFDDDARLSGPPEKMTLRATAAVLGNSETIKGFNAALKEQKSRSWHETTLGKIVETIATESGYEPRVSDDLAVETILHMDQTDESDLHFLSRLAKDRNAVAKPAGGFLLFVSRGKTKSATGLDLPEIELGKEDLTSWELQLSERNKYPAVRARWQDIEAGERQEEVVGSGSPIKTLKGNYPTQAVAMQAAAAELQRISTGSAKANYSLPGRADLAAEGVVRIRGLRGEFVGAWSVTKATHSFSDSGYTTQIECERLEDEA